jgi:RHS repeat-associated protein
MSILLKKGLGGRVCQGLLAALLPLVTLPALAMPGVSLQDEGISYADGFYQETATDLRVKVQGGYVSHRRQLKSGGDWQFNPDWADLHLQFQSDTDPEVDPPSSIRRNSYSYARAGKTNTYVYDERRRILRTASGYRWEDNSGNAITYNHAGQLLSYNDRNQVYVYFLRDEDGRISEVQDYQHATILSYTYTAAGLLQNVSDYRGREVIYTYTDGKLTQVRDVLGQTWQYEYGANQSAGAGKVILRTDPEGHQRQMLYTEQSDATCVQSVGGQWTLDATQTWSYSGARCLKYIKHKSPPLLSRVSDDEGQLYRYSMRYNEVTKIYTLAEVDGSNTLNVRSYNLDGEVISKGTNGRSTSEVIISGRTRTRVDENGNKTITENDEWLNPIKITYADGRSVTRRWEKRFSSLLEESDENGVITRHDYDAKGNRIRSTEAVGLPEQRVREYAYDAYGNQTQIKYVADANTAEATITMSYDSYGNLKKITDAEGNVTEYLAHDVLGNVLQRKDGRGHIWIQQYDAVGNLTQQTTPLGHSTRFAYDKMGNLTTITEPGNAITALEYDGRHRLIKTTNALGASSQIGYDGADRPVQISDALGYSVQLRYTREGKPASFTDAMGNTIGFHYGNAEGKLQQLLTAIDYPTFTQTLQYDERYRVSESKDHAEGSDARTMQFNYDGVGNPITETDALGRLSQNQYDAHQRQRTFIDAAQQLTQLQYDSRDNLLSVTNARSIAKWRYEYDHNGQLTKEKMPDNTALNYGYDGNGNLIQTVDAKGQAANYSYDADNRLTQAQYFSDLASAADPLNTQKTVNFSYDARDNLSAYDDGQTSASYQYDLANRLTQATVNYGAFSLTYSYTFDANGRKKTFTGPDNITYTYHYTPNGQLASVQIPGEGSYTVNQYQWLEPTQITLPGGGKHLTAYDGFMRPTQISGLDPAANAVQQDAYSYDVLDNILGRNSLEGIYNFGYDAVDRLQSVASELENNAFTYDGVGNRLSEAQITDPENNPVTWEYDSNDRLTQRGSIRYDYDANGSLIKKTNTETSEETRYTYNLENRLTEIRDSANVLIASYAYDPFGRRISKTINTTTTYYLYSDEGLVAEADAQGNITTSYLYKTDETWGTNPLLIRQNGMVGYYHNDHLGTPRLITAKSGAVLWKASYTAFGQATVTSNTMTNNLRFPGQYYDGESGLHYNYFRYYDPGVGRYVQSDPIGLGGGVNTFLYGEGNPVSNKDVDGLLSITTVVRLAYKACKVVAKISEWVNIYWQDQVDSIYEGFDYNEKLITEALTWSQKNCNGDPCADTRIECKEKALDYAHERYENNRKQRDERLDDIIRPPFDVPDCEFINGTKPSGRYEI